MSCDLGEVHGHLGRCDTDRHTVEDAADDQHGPPVAGNLEGCAYEPPDAGKHERVSAPDFVGDVSGHYGAYDGACGEGGSDGALGYAGWVVEVVAFGNVRIGVDGFGELDIVQCGYGTGQNKQIYACFTSFHLTLTSCHSGVFRAV
jgi:hypothetical protein